jgi:hypothetical protein
VPHSARGKVLGIFAAVARLDGLKGGTAFAGVALLALAAPFEMTRPLVRLPGQSISSLEACLIVAVGGWGLSIVAARRMPTWRTHLTWPWAALLIAMLASALVSPVSRTNALHMTGRTAAAFAVYLVAVNGLTTSARVRTAVALALASGVAVSVLAVLEYLRVGAALDALRVFRPGLAWVGAQMRAGGPLQYPTIASMYLEVVFASGLGLLLDAIDRIGDEGRAWPAAVVFVALLLVAEAIALTYTRAGLITIAASLVIVGAWRYRRQGLETGVRAVAALAAGIALGAAVSRSPSSLFLRFTSESQESWYRATIDAPLSIVVNAGSVTAIPVTVTNAGRLTWDSQANPPILLAYHWLAADSDRVVSYDGARTPFAAPVEAGQTVSVNARVTAPRQAGRYRLAWDVVQEHRLWFTTEPGAIPSLSSAVVRGAPGAIETFAPPLVPVRPGRFVLWSAAAKMLAAHPLFGVGPDNFRLSYGDYAELPTADPRVHSNNMYIEVAAGGGLVVFAAFVWLMRSTARSVSALLRTAPSTAIGAGLAAALIAIALHGVVDSFLSFAPTYILFALALGSATALSETPLFVAEPQVSAGAQFREGVPNFVRGHGGWAGTELSESQKSEVRSQNVMAARERDARERSGAQGPPRATEPGCGAEPHLGNHAHRV